MDDSIIVIRTVGEQAAGTVLDTVLEIPETAATSFTQAIEGTVTEKAVEGFRIRAGMTGEELAISVLIEGIMPVVRFHSVGSPFDSDTDRIISRVPDERTLHA